ISAGVGLYLAEALLGLGDLLAEVEIGFCVGAAFRGMKKIILAECLARCVDTATSKLASKRRVGCHSSRRRKLSMSFRVVKRFGFSLSLIWLVSSLAIAQRSYDDNSNQ